MSYVECGPWTLTLMNVVRTKCGALFYVCAIDRLAECVWLCDAHDEILPVGPHWFRLPVEEIVEVVSK